MDVVLRTILPGLLLLALAVGTATAQTSRSDAQAAIDRGNALVSEGSYQQALKHYQTISSESREYSTALYNIGVCHYELWRTDEAIDFYKRAIKERKGNYPRASYALGVALEYAGRLEEAKQAYEETLRATRSYAPANYRLGLIAFNAGDVETAARLFRKASQHAGQHLPASHNNLGVMLARMRRLPEAEKEFALALQLSNGAFSEAEHNLELCRRLLLRAGDEAGVLRAMTISIVD